MTEPRQIGQIMQIVTDEARLPASSTTPSTSADDLRHKTKFLETFRRWEILFKRKDGGDAKAEKWLIAEYYDSLNHLSEEGFDALTKRLRETLTFFPTIKECLDGIKPDGPYDWGHPFLKRPALFFRNTRSAVPALEAPPEAKRLGHDG